MGRRKRDRLKRLFLSPLGDMKRVQTRIRQELLAGRLGSIETYLSLRAKRGTLIIPTQWHRDCFVTLCLADKLKLTTALRVPSRINQGFPEGDSHDSLDPAR